MALLLFRYLALWLALAVSGLAPYWALQSDAAVFWWLAAVGAWALTALGIHDLTQTHHAILPPNSTHSSDFNLRQTS